MMYRDNKFPYRPVLHCTVMVKLRKWTIGIYVATLADLDVLEAITFY